MEPTKLGPYDIGPRLGKGGMGSVYRGVNAETGETVAIKALAPQLATAEGFRERFEAEIESLKTLKHDGIVRLYGYGEEGGTLFYAMELVEGKSLEEELKAGRRFNWREVVDITIQVCRALKHAHDHGIVHRDIKPANILLDSTPGSSPDDDAPEKVKLADFGIARLFGGSQLTMAGGVLGTADYMSPEQAEGRPVTDKCDQYSLGCVMYALLAGRPPFQSKSLPEMLQLQRFAEPEPVRRYARRAPEQLELAISQLLSKDPSDRFPNTIVLAKHLEAMRRALSRPFDDAKLEPQPTPAVEEVPIELAETRGDDKQLAAADNNDFSLGDSIDLEEPPTALREAATIDSIAAPKEATGLGGPAPRRDHFTTVDPAGERRTSSSWSLSAILAALGLIGLVAAFGFLLFKMSQPYDSDTLYQTIRPTDDAPMLEELRGRENRIEEFLTRFASDPRAAEVRDYSEQLELDRLERRFEARARGRGSDEALLTAERIYLSAVRQADAKPAAAARQLDDLLALYSGDASTEMGDSSIENEREQRRLEACLCLARQQLERLETQLKTEFEADLATIVARLDAAEAMHQDSPAEAKAICQAVIDLYTEAPWASEAVQRASKLLESWP